MSDLFDDLPDDLPFTPDVKPVNTPSTPVNTSQHLRWAHRIMERHKNGDETLLVIQVDMAQRALGLKR